MEAQQIHPMEIKKGDRISCKKSYKYDVGTFKQGSYKYDVGTFKQGSYYYIESINRSLSPAYNYVFIYTGGWVGGGMVKVMMVDFKNHFCTEQELRILKLKKLEKR